MRKLVFRKEKKKSINAPSKTQTLQLSQEPALSWRLLNAYYFMSTTELPIEEHPFAPHVPSNANTLIIGSFPVMEGGSADDNGEKWFYSASKNQFWALLGKVYDTDLSTVKLRKELCDTQGIAVTDIFKRISRKNPGAADKYLIEVEGNEEAIRTILETGTIKRILFTSKFVEGHFKKKFPDNSYNSAVLPSPSGAANIPISKSLDYKKHLEEFPEGNTKSYRVKKYSELLKKK